MKKIILSAALCASLAFAANSEYKYEITPLVGGNITEGNLNLDDHYGVGGLSFGVNFDDTLYDQIEVGILTSLEQVDYDGINEDTNITRLFTNFVKDYGLTENTSLYALVGVGLEHFENEELGNKTSLFGNYGVGLKYKFSNDMALKTDIRHLINTNDRDNNLIYTVGLAIPFGEKAAPAPKEEKVEPKPAIAKLADTDGDGVPDIKDKCPDTPKGDIVDENGCSLKVNLNINFDFDSARINNEYDSKIKKFADFMKKFPSVKGKIEAHTDSVGTEDYNQKLSERRAAATVKALEEQGVDKSRLNSTGYGESKPKATNETAEGRAENRRVEGSIQR
ncbi:OmpA family protein [Halarcobacter bivalviorum]|uniref:Flagellar motor protein MotB n=1 Tax=Halarcobacter bivalviorum TaxID=663364 RepID=A0AAX2A4R4_9BACT|nr:OmpA family protein [Halarcobacter bivalviorum]AXH11585.1 outer membrane fibronectin-binding protein [Halarcobacter bivalviorum]RXK02901.1 flagellar motor protein MotB [Halarcobacter bivalviorum]RXK08910.1 flagellar motor protein MotB [Halarcobacter bivalviorum]